jgi:hypothetical protein
MTTRMLRAFDTLLRLTVLAGDVVETVLDGSRQGNSQGC